MIIFGLWQQRIELALLQKIVDKIGLRNFKANKGGEQKNQQRLQTNSEAEVMPVVGGICSHWQNGFALHRVGEVFARNIDV